MFALPLLSREHAFRCIAALFLLFVISRSFAATEASPPNVLIIQTDEHTFRTLGCYRALLPDDQAYVWGPGIAVETPHIDWLARHGALADRAYATSPVCTPSRAAMMTGLYPQNTGSIRNDRPMRDDMVTFAEVLRQTGYRTGYAGKWHLDGDGKPQWAPARQFGWEDNRYMFNRGHWKILAEDANGPRVASVDANGQPTYAPGNADEKSFTTDFLTDRAITFIRDHAGDPFCYMLAIPDPHGPHHVRAPYDTMYDHFDFQQPASANAEGHRLPDYANKAADPFRPAWMSIYFGMVKCIDDNVGRLLDTLRDEGILENTVIVFTSDHGDMCGEHGRYNKGRPMETSARIPFIVHAPGTVPAGTIMPQPFGTVDFKPTLLALLGIDDPSTNQGRDFSGHFRQDPATIGWESLAFIRNGGSAADPRGAYEEDTGWIGAFGRQFKLVFGATDIPVLFDIENDPHELTNLIDSPAHRVIIRQMARELKRYAETHFEPHLSSTRIRADLAWAISDAPHYPDL